MVTGPKGISDVELQFWEDHQPGPGRRGVCDTFIYGHGKPHLHSAVVCHAMLFNSGGSDYLSSSLRPKHGGLDVANDYWDMMFDKQHSPWRKWIQDVQFILDDRSQRIAFRLPKLADMPTQIVASLCIASRHCYELPEHALMYGLLRDKGFSQIEALYGSIYFALDDQKEWVSIYSNGGGHFAFSTYINQGIKHLIQGNPLNLKKTLFKNSGDYSGVSNIWAVKNPDILKVCPVLLTPKTKHQYGGVFKRHFEKTQKARYAVLKILPKEFIPRFREQLEKWYDCNEES